MSTSGSSALGESGQCVIPTICDGSVARFYGYGAMTHFPKPGAGMLGAFGSAVLFSFGHSFRRVCRARVLASTLLVLMSAYSGADAATPNVVGGQLVGATDVVVQGKLYDVEFVDGTCIAVFDGCEDVEDADFETLEEATAASQALLDQVLLDGGAGSFDSSPSLTLGCTDSTMCAVYTVFTVHVAHHIAVGIARNFESGGLEDFADAEAFGLPIDTGLMSDTVFARWTAVPVAAPGPPAALSALALLAIGLRELSRRSKSIESDPT